jgi:hypothetical protein
MKQARLVLTALAVLMAGSAALAIACDQSKMKGTSASAAGMCSHDAKGVSAAAAGMCSHDAKGVSAAAAGMCSHDAKGVSAAAAGMCDHDAKGVSAAKSGGACSGHGMATSAARSTHGDCEACLDMAGCEQEIESVGAGTQVVPLKNGVMFIYTANTPASVHAVQAAMARRNDHMIQFASAGDKTKMCSNCKAMRSAAASGKLSREVVNIEGGCLTLVTSSDPSLVSKIHAMAGITTASRVKS